MADPYATLGVPVDAAPSDIKKAFRALARQGIPTWPVTTRPLLHASPRSARPTAAHRSRGTGRPRPPQARAARRRAAEQGGFRMPGGFWSNQGFSKRGDPSPKAAPSGRGGVPQSTWTSKTSSVTLAVAWAPPCRPAVAAEPPGHPGHVLGRILTRSRGRIRLRNRRLQRGQRGGVAQRGLGGPLAEPTPRPGHHPGR